MPESDRDILIELRTKVSDIHFNMTQPGGRVPQLEAKVEGHSGALKKVEGAASMAKWIIGIVITLVVAVIGIAGVLLDHLLKGK